MTKEKETYSVVNVTGDSRLNVSKITGLADLPCISGSFKQVGFKNDRYLYQSESNRNLTLEFADDDRFGGKWEFKWQGRNKHTVAYCFTNSASPPRN